MSSYIYIKNFYLEDIQRIVQDYFNSTYSEDTQLQAEILMKNSRTYFIRFNEKLAIEEILDWVNTFQNNNPTNERTTIIEGYMDMNEIKYKFYYINDELYAINSNNESFKVQDLEELIPITNIKQEFISTEIPSKNLHSMKVIKFETPKKKWWKIW